MGDHAKKPSAGRWDSMVFWPAEGFVGLERDRPSSKTTPPLKTDQPLASTRVWAKTTVFGQRPHRYLSICLVFSRLQPLNRCFLI